MGMLKDRVFTEAQLRAGTSTKLPCEHQVGDDVWVWIDELTYLEGILQGVSISNKHLVSYDVAFEVGRSGMYVVQYGLRGCLTKPGEAFHNNQLTKPEEMNAVARDITKH